MIVEKYVYYVTFRGCPLINYWIRKFVIEEWLAVSSS
jgi:hypothetical protein